VVCLKKLIPGYFFPENLAFSIIFSIQSRMSTTFSENCKHPALYSEQALVLNSKWRARPSHKLFILCGLDCIEELASRQGQSGALRAPRCRLKGTLTWSSRCLSFSLCRAQLVLCKRSKDDVENNLPERPLYILCTRSGREAVEKQLRDHASW